MNGFPTIQTGGLVDLQSLVYSYLANAQGRASLPNPASLGPCVCASASAPGTLTGNLTNCEGSVGGPPPVLQIKMFHCWNGKGLLPSSKASEGFPF